MLINVIGDKKADFIRLEGEGGNNQFCTFTYGDGTTGLTNTLWFDSDPRNSIPVEIQVARGDSIFGHVQNSLPLAA